MRQYIDYYTDKKGHVVKVITTFHNEPSDEAIEQMAKTASDIYWKHNNKE